MGQSGLVEVDSGSISEVEPTQDLLTSLDGYVWEREDKHICKSFGPSNWKEGCMVFWDWSDFRKNRLDSVGKKYHVYYVLNHHICVAIFSFSILFHQSTLWTYPSTTLFWFYSFSVHFWYLVGQDCLYYLFFLGFFGGLFLLMNGRFNYSSYWKYTEFIG